MFDAYYDGDTRSSDSGSNFAIIKQGDALIFGAEFGIAAGSIASFDDKLVIDSTSVTVTDDLILGTADDYHYLAVGAGDSTEIHGENWIRLYTGAGVNNAAFYARGTGAANYMPQYTTNGTVTTTGSNGQLAVSSDIRLKQDIEEIGPSLNKVMKIKSYTFRLKDNPKDSYTGFIAQQVEKFLPDVVDGKNVEYMWEVNNDGTPVKYENGNLVFRTDENGEKIPRYRGLSDVALIAHLYSAVQELAKKVYGENYFD
jgi:hypothetical protein